MNTRETILQLADDLIREKGFNAFSFYDLAREIGIKTASIHYHFPTKRDLGAEVIRKQKEQFRRLKQELGSRPPDEQLDGFFEIYARLKSENRICLVGSLATDLNTMDAEIKKELTDLAGFVLDWIAGMLQAGKEQGVFAFRGSARVRALMIITNMVAAIQLARLADTSDFETVKQTIINDLKPEL